MSAKKKQSAAKKGTGSKQGMNANPVIVKEEKNRLFLPVVADNGCYSIDCTLNNRSLRLK
jgi:hypothetical protein